MTYILRRLLKTALERVVVIKIMTGFIKTQSLPQLNVYWSCPHSYLQPCFKPFTHSLPHSVLFVNVRLSLSSLWPSLASSLLPPHSSTPNPNPLSLHPPHTPIFMPQLLPHRTNSRFSPCNFWGLNFWLGPTRRRTEPRWNPTAKTPAKIALLNHQKEAKLFVGNLPYDVDNQKLAMLFEQVGTVEIAEVRNKEREAFYLLVF